MALFCDICLNFERVYPKQNITGSVAVTSNSKSTIQHIIIEVFRLPDICIVKLVVLGIAESHWKYTKHLVKSLKLYKKGTMFSGKQEFFLSRHTLAGGTAGNFILQKTPQVYPFKCGLPEYLPATWTGSCGTIKYIAQVFIKEEKGATYVFSKEVRVYPRRNLKLEQHLLCEAQKTVRRTFRYAAINLGTVDVSIWLPMCGIAAGQSLPLLCSVKNASKIQFGGLIFVLTQMEIYRSTKPTRAAKTCRSDICRVARMVDILQGTYEYYCVLETDPEVVPTNQFGRCKCCHVAYEVWVSVQGAIPRYNAYGYPNIDTPGIPVIIGTEPLNKWDGREITNDVMGAVYSMHPPIEMEALPPDDEVEEMLNIADEELDEETEQNLARQLVDEGIFEEVTTISTESELSNKDAAGKEISKEEVAVKVTE